MVPYHQRARHDRAAAPGRSFTLRRGSGSGRVPGNSARNASRLGRTELPGWQGSSGARAVRVVSVAATPECIPDCGGYPPGGRYTAGIIAIPAPGVVNPGAVLHSACPGRVLTGYWGRFGDEAHLGQDGGGLDTGPPLVGHVLARIWARFGHLGIWGRKKNLPPQSKIVANITPG